MAEANFADKTTWTGDNLDILRGLDCGCVGAGNHKGCPYSGLGRPLWPPRCAGGRGFPRARE